MTTSTFDALGTAQDLEAAGIERKHAEAIAKGMRRAAGADHDDLATKADLAELRTGMTGKIGALRVEIRIIGALVLAIAAKLFGIFNAVAAVLA